MAQPEVIYSVDLRLEQEADTSVQDTRFAAERRAFWAMHPQLLKAYEGKYVAILNGKVVDCDEDKHALAKRLYRRFGYQPIYVQLVTTASWPVYRLSSPRRTLRS
jgi:hypothetical protein